MVKFATMAQYVLSKKIPYNFPYWGKLWGISIS